jgi:hypothetical protein
MKPLTLLMLIISSLGLKGQEYIRIEDSLIVNTSRLNSDCDTSVLELKQISFVPDSYEYLRTNNYCYTIFPACTSITYSFTFTSLADNFIYINSGYSVLSCTNVNFLYSGLYDNTTCQFIDEGYSFEILEGHTYTWTLNAEAAGRFCQGFNAICPYWFIDTPLAVELVSFKAESYDGHVELEWTTASETNSHYFVIEKSSDYGQFAECKRVKAYGNSNFMINYSIKDDKPFENANYYRIVEYDLNGKRTEHSTVYVYYPYRVNYKVYDVMGLPTNLNSPGVKIIKYDNGNTIKKVIIN